LLHDEFTAEFQKVSGVGDVSRCALRFLLSLLASTSRLALRNMTPGLELLGRVSECPVSKTHRTFRTVSPGPKFTVSDSFGRFVRFKGVSSQPGNHPPNE
jgi:hypothetical protein